MGLDAEASAGKSTPALDSKSSCNARRSGVGTKVGFSSIVEVQPQWWRNKHGDMFLSHSQEGKGVRRV